MPSQKFDISVLLNVASNGNDVVTRLQRKLERLANTAATVNPALSRALSSISSGIIDKQAQKLGNSLTDLIRLTDQLQKKTGGVGNFKFLDALERRLGKLRTDARKGIKVDLSFEQANLQVAEQRLKQILRIAKETNDVDTLRFATEGLKRLKDIESEVKLINKLRMDKGLSDYRISLNKINEDINKTLKEVNKLKASGADPKILAKYKKQISESRKELIALKSQAEATGRSTVEINVKIDKLDRAQNLLNLYTDKVSSANRLKIVTEVKDTKSIRDIIKYVEQLNKELSLAQKAGDIKAVDSIRTKIQGLREDVNGKQKASNNSGNIKNVKIFEQTNQALDALDKRIDDFNKNSGNKIFFDSFSARLSNLRAEANKGILLDVEYDKAKLTELEQQFKQIKRDATNLGNDDLANFAENALVTIRQYKKELTSLEKISLSKNVSKYKIDLNNVEEELQAILKKVEQLNASGASSAAFQPYRAKLLVVKQELTALISEAERLGKDTTTLRVKLNDVEKGINYLQSIDDHVARINREQILLKFREDRGIKELLEDLKNINEEIREASKNRDFKALKNLAARANDLKGEIFNRRDAASDSGDAKGFKFYDGLQEELTKSQKAIYGFTRKSPLGEYFESIKLRSKEVFGGGGGAGGGFGGATLKALSGSLRIVGTSAFLVGGQLRSLGFAFSALGAIVQNILPLFIDMYKVLGPVSIPLGLLLAKISLLSIELLALAGALAFVAKTGLEFNNNIQRANNSISAIVNEFYVVTDAAGNIIENFRGATGAAAQFSAASTLVTAQLKGLSAAALVTEFTTQELVPAFQAVVTTAGKFGGSLSTYNNLTIGLARVSSIAGVSASDLSSSITQLISGTGRVTNPLQRYFNTLKDSKGIELTAKRIRQLRAEGGTKLIKELLEATNRFEVLGSKQAETLSGSFSNIIDAFELFAAGATTKAYDTLRLGFGSIKNLITKEVSVIDSTTGAVIKEIQFLPAFQKLSESLDSLFNKISVDIVDALREVIDYIVRFAEELNRNPEVFDDIYRSTVSISKSLFEILTTLFKIVGLSGEVGSDIETIKKSFVSIAAIMKVIAFLFSESSKIFNILPPQLNVVINFLNFMLDILNSITGKKWKIDISLGSGFLGFGKIVELYDYLVKANEKPKIKESSATFGQLTAGLVGSDTTFDTVENGKKVTKRKFNVGETFANTVGKEGPGIGQDPFTKNSKFDPFTKEANDLRLKSKGGKTDSGDKTNKSRVKADRDASKQILEARKAFEEAKFNLANAKEEGQLNLVRDRLQRQQSIIDTALQTQVISQGRASEEISALRAKEIAADLQGKLNERQRVLDTAAAKEVAYLAATDKLKQSKLKSNVKADRLQILELGRNKEILDDKVKTVKIDEEIIKLQEKKLDIQLELLKAQFDNTKNIVKELQDAQKELTDLQDPLEFSTFNSRIRNIAIDRSEELRKVQTAIEDIQNKSRAVGFLGAAQAAVDAKNLKDLQERKDTLNLIGNRIVQNERFAFLEANAQQELNALQQEQAVLDLKLEEGKIRQLDYDKESLVLKLQYAEAIDKIIQQLSKQADSELGITAEQKNRLEQLKQQSAELKKVVADSGVRGALSTINDGFESFFERLQDGTTSAKDAFTDLAQTILGTFRKLIAQRLTEQIFSKFFDNENSPVGKVFDKLGLNRNAELRRQAEAQNKTTVNPRLNSITGEGQDNYGNLAGKLSTPQTFEELVKQANTEFAQRTGFITDAINNLAVKINQAVTTIGDYSIGAAEVDAQSVINNGINDLKQVTDFNGNRSFEQIERVNSGIINALTSVEAAIQRISVGGEGLDKNKVLLETIGSLTNPDGAKNGGRVVRAATGGNIVGSKGKDTIPAMLSNGEFVFRPEVVKKLGLGFLHYMNNEGKIPGLATGGSAFTNFASSLYKGSGVTKGYSYLDGGVQLLKKLEPIKEAAAAPPKKKISKFRSILGNALSFAAPFLKFIPVVGPLLSIGAGIAGGALTGSNGGGLKGAILGGLFGGLGNFNFGGSSGILGKISGGLNSGTGKTGLSLFSGLFGNAGGNTGQSLAGLFSGSGGKFSLSNLTNLFKGGGGGGLSGILKALGLNFADGGSAGGASTAKLLALFAAISSISSLFKSSASSSDIEEIVADPDAARKNALGSAYVPLIESGFARDFEYTPETLKKLQNQFNGIRNTVKTPKQGFGSKLGAILPSIFGLLGAFGGGANKVGTASTGANGAVDLAKKLFGGFAVGGLVTGKGTATSDSIFSKVANDSFVVKAKSVDSIGLDMLNALNSGKLSFAEGGLASAESALGSSLESKAPIVNAGAEVSIHNYGNMEDAVAGHLKTPQGRKSVLNVLGMEKTKARRLIYGR